MLYPPIDIPLIGLFAVLFEAYDGLVEVPIGTTLRKLVFDIGGGIPKGRKFKAIQTGGPSGGCIPAKYLDTPIDYETLTRLGSIMGSGGMIVLDENTCMVDIAHYYLSFTESESCGKCAPCRIGIKRMLEILTRIKEGRGEIEDIDRLIYLGEIIKDSALCGLGQTAPNPVLTTIKYFRSEYEAHIKENKCLASSCEEIVYAPCQHSCPLGMDVPGYVNLIADNEFEKAFEIIMEDNPLPGVCGRVCHHPCEIKCKRGEVDDPIAIAHLKRFVSDRKLHKRESFPKPTPRLIKDAVAIIGSGPAGLTCAYYLIKEGIPVTIFESLPVLGGMLSVCIPEYRLPRKILDYEIERILNLGVEIVTGVTVGKDVTIGKLFKKGYKAAFIAVGAQKSRKLGIPRENTGSVIHGIEFLRNINLGKKVKIGNHVVVVGGGNAAIDSARVALRLGKKVTIVYRRSRKEMPAEASEVEMAENEGVRILYLTTPEKIIYKNGKLKGLECIKLYLGNADESGRRRPLPIPNSSFLIEADTIIPAIGQSVDSTFASGKSKIEFTRAGTIKVDKLTLATNLPGIYAGGDVVNGPSTVTESMAAGKNAASSIVQYLRGEPVKRTPTIKKKKEVDKKPEEIEVGERSREKIAIAPARKRIHNFEEVVNDYSKTQAVREAKRCLKCHIVEKETS